MGVTSVAELVIIFYEDVIFKGRITDPQLVPPKLQWQETAETVHSFKRDEMLGIK